MGSREPNQAGHKNKRYIFFPRTFGRRKIGWMSANLDLDHHSELQDPY